MRPPPTVGQAGAEAEPTGTGVQPSPPPEKPRSARGIVWARRRRSAERVWALFRKNKLGMTGLVILIGFILIAIFAPLLAAPETLKATCECNGVPYSPPSLEFPFGTDNFGRSVLSLTIWGARPSLIIGLLATAIAMGLGSIIGIVAGYFGRWPETVLMRLTDWFLVIPFLPLAIVLASILGQSLGVIIFVIGVTSWPSTARIVRAQVLSVKTRPYVERGQALGAGTWHLVSRHILPNVVTPAIIIATFGVAAAIIGEATLSFLGVGIQPPTPTWGNMLADGRAYVASAWWLATFPGLAIMLTVLSINVIGDWLRDYLDPRLRNTVD
jgi:peptide/nickel transport system permease protein